MSHVKPDRDPLLHKAAFNGEAGALATLLLSRKHRHYLNWKNRLGCTPLRLAATGGCVQCVGLLLEAGAHIDEPDIKGQTPLHVAVKCKHLACIQVLLSRGADPDGSRMCLYSPLYIASLDGHLPGLRELVRYGADLEGASRQNASQAGFNKTPLHMAIAYHQLPCFKYLLFAGADLNSISSGRSSRKKTLTSQTNLNLVKQNTQHLHCNSVGEAYNHCGEGTSASQTEDDNAIAKKERNTGFEELKQPEKSANNEDNLVSLHAMCSPPVPPPPPPISHVKDNNMGNVGSLFHYVIKHNVEAIYAEMLFDFGADIYQRNEKGKLPYELENDNECATFIKSLYDEPKSLSSRCRIVIRQHLARDPWNLRSWTFHDVTWSPFVTPLHECIEGLPLPKSIIQYLQFYKLLHET